MTTMNFGYTSSASMRQILQDLLPVQTMDDPLFQDLMPITSDDVDTLLWEQRDNYKGLLSPRALDSGFSNVKREGMKTYKADPGYYGDQKTLNEAFLTVSRAPGTFANAIDISREQAGDQVHLLHRAINRMRKIGWDLFVTGTYSVLGPNATVFATDSFALQSYTASVAWSNRPAAAPLDDMFQMKLKYRGSSVRFDRSSKLYVNATTLNHALRNTNPNDIGGRRTLTATGQIQPMSVDQLNQILADQNLPMLVEYDRGYEPETGSYTLFIPDGKGVLVGARETGEPVSDFCFTRNPNNMGAAGAKSLADIYYDFEMKKNPLRFITTLGMNGGVRVYFPSAIVKVTL